MEKINANGGDAFIVKEGSMYPTLYRLEDKGYISSQKKQIGKRQIRIYYHIENAGREYFNALKKAYYEINHAVCNILKYGEEDRNV
ncbi:MAG: PadR family transcriptional regulator [Clostridium sp.]|nr:PadR family transcriptional regulator [Clostridium sp.]